MRIVVFGMGKAGRTILSYTLQKGNDIVAVIDNNKSLWNKRIEGYMISDPAILHEIAYDLVLVAIVKDYCTVREQLLSMGVPDIKIRPASGWLKVQYMDDDLDEFFYVEKHVVPFEKKPVDGSLPGGEETKKAHARRLREGFFDKYCKGEGLDIGCASDPLTTTCSGWDLPNGDAQYLRGIDDESFDFVYSSHCLEHMCDVRVALKNWFRVVRKGGTLIVYIPHRNLYEKRKKLPSRWSIDHKHMFLIGEAEEPDTLDIVEEIRNSLTGYDIEYIKKCAEGHTIDNPSVHSDGEYSIEIVIRKLIDF